MSGERSPRLPDEAASGRGPSAAAKPPIRHLGGARHPLVPLVIGAVAVLAFVAVVVGLVIGHHRQAAVAGSAQADTSAAVLAPTTGEAGGETVDGIQSSPIEQVLFHIHAHLAIYVDGQQKLVPYGIGIVPPYRLQNTKDGPFVAGGSKFYWLHTHDETGVIHIESPVQRTFTLANLFDLWHQPLGPAQLGPAAGPVTTFVNAHQVAGDPRDIPLGPHDVIQLDVGSVVPFHPYAFTNGL